MRKGLLPDWLEQLRVDGETQWGYAAGRFHIPYKNTGRSLNITVSNGDQWEKMNLRLPAFEHASVSGFFFIGTKPKYVTPVWEEMCYVKDLFWEPEECVIQYHPPHSEYVNIHEHVLHLWKPIGVEVPLPPKRCV